MAEKHSKWKNRLLRRTGAVDRLEVWDYVQERSGRHHRSTRAETTDRHDIQDFLDAIEIDEASSTGRCMCLGSPHIDLFADDELIAALSLHHGVRLRWNHHWPADAELTRSGAFALCEWFLRHGIGDPMSELRGHMNRSLAGRRRTLKLRKLLPAEFGERFARTPAREHVAGLFLGAGEDRATLATWCLRILGCDNSSWELIDHITHAQELATEVMPQLGREACGTALQRAVQGDGDLDACFGAARALFYFGAWENFSRGSLNASLPALIQVSIRHPRRRNRQYVMWALSRIDGGDEPLRWVLRGDSTPFELLADEMPEPEGNLFPRMLDGDEPTDASDQAYAAWRLAGMGVSDVRDRIRRLADLASGLDRRIFQRALTAIGD